MILVPHFSDFGCILFISQVSIYQLFFIISKFFFPPHQKKFFQFLFFFRILNYLVHFQASSLQSFFFCFMMILLEFETGGFLGSFTSFLMNMLRTWDWWVPIHSKLKSRYYSDKKSPNRVKKLDGTRLGDKKSLNLNRLFF